MLNPKIKLLQLRRLQYTPGLIVKPDGPLLSKGGPSTKSLTDYVKEQIVQGVKEFNWSAPPRARVAVSFSFFSDQRNPPEVYNLIKYYLDLLQGTVFKDDRQVQYLDTSIWRSHPKDLHSSSSLYVHVRRLSDYVKLIDLCKDSDAFNEYHTDTYIHYQIVEEDLWNDAERLYGLLQCNRIMPYDIPRNNNPFLKELVNDFNAIHPLIMDIGSLPKHGQSEYFKQMIASSFSELVMKYPDLNKIPIPVEFDVQVPRSGINHSKDLDNIMITICNQAKNTLLHSKSFINGYRIYVADRVDPSIKSGLQVKLLPPGEIEAYHDRIRKAFDSLENDLEELM